MEGPVEWTMASRSSERRRPPPIAPTERQNALAPPLPHRRARTNPRSGGVDHLQPPQHSLYCQHNQSESSSDNDTLIPVEARRPSNSPVGPSPSQHSRSMSNPFPSLFTANKKKAQLGIDESTDDDSRRPEQAPRSRTDPKKGPRVQAELRNGNCMTCGGLVRWPKELDVFRCTICSTINDLKPYIPRPEERPLPISPRPISLVYTRNLVQQSLRQALVSFVASGGPKLTPEPWPTRPSSRVSQDYFSRIESSKHHGRSPSFGGPSPLLHVPVFDEANDGTSEPIPLDPSAPASRSYSSSHADPRAHARMGDVPSAQNGTLDPRTIFKSVEDYVISSFALHNNVNSSFTLRRQSVSSRQPMQIKRKPVPLPAPSLPTPTLLPQTSQSERPLLQDDNLVSELDAKMLLVGDFAENAGWWAGEQLEKPSPSGPQQKSEMSSLVNARSPRVDWGELLEWYHLTVDATRVWAEMYKDEAHKHAYKDLTPQRWQQFENIILNAQWHLQRVLLKCTETLLKRPGRLLKDPQDIRFLLIILANPLLTKTSTTYRGSHHQVGKGKNVFAAPMNTDDERTGGGNHSGIVKRILGLMANSSDHCHHHLVMWFSRLPEHVFFHIKDLISSFVNYRLVRQNEKKIEPQFDVTGGLIPQMPNNRSGNTPATLHAALEKSKSNKPVSARLKYSDDWQLKAGARAMALVFAANNLTHVRRNEVSVRHAHGHLLATSDFYNTLLDCLDFKTDFEMWESRRGRFTFCQYPFFLSIWAKIQILEFDAKRQMQGRAREALFDSILTHKTFDQYLCLSVRRDCIVEDSLARISEVVGSGSEDIKKGLRIEFQGEEGVDAGGLRKEWFLLLVREVFNPDHGLFAFDEDSQYCYFNPHTFETSDQYFLVGVVLGLAIYNSIILDVALPPFAFRKLLAAAPSTSAMSAQQRPSITYTLDDLAEYRPRLAQGLRQLLDFEGDVESTFCLDFVVEIERYGERDRIPLFPGGESRPVTNSNRREFVNLYVRHLLDTSVSRQFEPFKRGFYTVCAGNALSLFRPEEIELLVRGSDEALDISSLRAVARYTNWDNKKTETEPEHEPTIDWFWDTFAAASPRDQRRLLSFITGSDRIPAMGAASLVIKISCLGDDIGRYPTARTCFNVLSLFRYHRRERLEISLWRAVHESEGFGLK